MPSNKPRIATYTTENNIQKFRIIAAYKGKSMSEYLQTIVEETIKDFEAEHGQIIIPETESQE